MRRAPQPMTWLAQGGVLARAFPVLPPDRLLASQFDLRGDLAELSSSFNRAGGSSLFADAGCLVDRTVSTMGLKPRHSGHRTTLGDVLVREEDVPTEFFVSERLEEWAYLKGAKALKRVSRATGHEYAYSEGGMTFPDPVDRPSRTVITGEGGATPSRFKHVVLTPSGRYRRLVPVELERLNMFPDNHTAGLKPAQRAFLMGNALVTGIVRNVGVTLASAIDEHSLEATPLRRQRDVATPVGTAVSLFDPRV